MGKIGTFIKQNITSGKLDWFVLIPIATLMLLSISFVYSASATYAEFRFGSKETLFINHTIRILLAIFTLFFFAKVDYHLWAKHSKVIMGIGLGLLFFVLIAGSNLKGASRWISLGFISFQPSEFAKFALILHLSVLMTKHGERIRDFKEGLAPLLIWSGAVSLLIVLQPNMSTAMVIMMISVTMMFIGNAHPKHIFALGGGGVALASLFITIKGGFHLKRILAFFSDPAEGDMLDSFGYQLKQSLIAFGNGGLFGLGPGSNRQSNFFLPEAYQDFIFSIIGEEYGFVGVVVILLTFAFILWRGMIIAKHAPDRIGYYLAFGIVLTYSLYAFINAGVNSGVLPTTGLPMPFLSYGGTAVLFNAAAAGILLNISAQGQIYPSSTGNPLKS